MPLAKDMNNGSVDGLGGDRNTWMTETVAGARNHPLSEATKEVNRVKSVIRSCIEQAVGGMTISMGGKLAGKHGLERAEAWWGPKNLSVNFLRHLQCTSGLNATE